MPELSTLSYIIIFTLIGSVFSLIGGIILLLKEKVAIKFSHFLAAFAAGTLLGTVFFELLPEAVHGTHEAEEGGGGEMNIFLFTLLGFILFYLIERSIHWYHHHQHEFDDKKTEPTIPLVVLGDTVHNFIDGVVIAATFLVNIPLGVVTTLAVAAHEIPQEMGDFGILIHKGLERKKIILVNIMSALAALFGALITYFLGERIEGILPILLSLTAGFFIYIAASDLIPEIHHENRRGFAFAETALLIFGILSIWLILYLLGVLGLHGDH